MPFGSLLKNLIQNLTKANQRLKEAARLKSTRIHKDATIQRFEFTFELTWKTIQEYIRDQGFDCKSPKSCIREAGRLEIIEDVEKWFEFLEHRNLIAHTYNEKIADKIYKKALNFPKEIDKLLAKLKGEKS
jgi:nucleotidyltransferase substrate binding protein (TIGR01987 family)